MKKLLIGLLALGSISAFAQSASKSNVTFEGSKKYKECKAILDIVEQLFRESDQLRKEGVALIEKSKLLIESSDISEQDEA